MYMPFDLLELSTQVQTCRRAFARWQFLILTGAFTSFPWHMLLSIAPSILLTRLAALAVMAYVIAYEASVTTLTYPNLGWLYHVMHGGRLSLVSPAKACLMLFL